VPRRDAPSTTTAGASSRALAALRAVLGNPGIRRIELAWTCGIAGDTALLVALLVVAFEAGGALAVGLVAVARTAPAIVTGPLAGLLAGRSHPTRLLRLVHLGRAAASAGLTAWIAAGWPFAGLLVLVVLASIAGSLVRPLTITSLPSLARDPGELVAGNVVMSTGEGVGAFLGPVAAGLIVAAAGPAPAAALASLTFAVGAAAMLAARASGDAAAEVAADRRSGEVASGAATGAWDALRDSLVAGPAALRRAPGAAAIIVDFNGQTVVRYLSTTLAVVLSFELLGLGEPGVGLLAAAFGLGNLAGALGAVGLAGRRRLGPIFALALVAWGLPYAVIGAAPLLLVAVAGYVISGLGNGVLDVAGFTLVQRSVPNAARVPVFGLLEATIGVSAAIGGLIAPLLIEAFGTRGALGITGAILPILAVATWPQVDRVDDEARIPDEEIGLIRGIPLFASLPMTALERLATALRPMNRAAGETIFLEGDPGDVYVIIAEGDVEVSQGGRVINRLGGGEGIGEIALVKSVPRTATVRALTTTRGYELSGPDFQAAIAGPSSAAAARLVAEERLGRSSG
jgi:MFS family permease